MSRGVPSVAEMIPACALPMVAFGKSNCGWLRTLNNSPRNCTWTRSETAMSLNKEVSRLKRPGPRRIFLPASPNVYKAGVDHTAPGTLNDVLNQSLRVGFESVAFTPELMLGRLDEPVFATELARTGVKGSLVCAVRMMFSCQPPKALFAHDFPKSNLCPFPIGR